MSELGAGTRFSEYVIERLVGRGGFGAVYLARDTRLERRVALKILEPHLATDPDARRRFIDESRQAASLDHPNIVPIYEAGEAEGRLFLAMRYVPGPDLGGLLDREGALEPIRAGRIVAQVASALDAAHAAGLVHRDVKPGNVLLATGTDEVDHAYLTDFGLSKRVSGGGGVSQTRAGRFVGTVGYVAPEQVKGRSIDARADTYSLACLAFHALTGGLPFERDSEIGTLGAHTDDPPPSVHAVLPDVADRVDPVLAKAMAKEPAARYGSSGAFAADLSAALASRSAGATVTRGFLFADLRGYTAFIEEHGDDAAVRLLDAFRRMVRLVVAREGGAEIKTEGDSFYVVFDSASAAVRAGLGIVAGARAETAARPELPMHVGVGVHAGESAAWVEGYVGSNVNIAARLCAQADEGEVLVSDTVRTLIRTSGALSFDDRGTRTLKGIDEPMAVYAAHPAGETAAPARAKPRATRSRRSPLLAAAVVGVLVLAVAGIGWLLVGGGGEAPSEHVIFSRVIPRGDGDFVCTERDPIDAKLFVADVAGGQPPSRVTSGTDLLEFFPAWSADGSMVATRGATQSGEPGIYRVDPTGEVNEIQGTAPNLHVDDSPRVAISPDGLWLTWPKGSQQPFYALAALDGSESRLIRASVAGDQAATETVNSGTESPRVFDVTYLPDGRLLTGWTTWQSGSTTWLETMEPDGTDRRPVALDLAGRQFGSLRLSPDGTRVLMAELLDRDSADYEDIWGDTRLEWYVARLNGDPPVLEPIAIDAIYQGVEWSADGSSIHYVPRASPSRLVDHDPDAGEERVIVELETGVICGPLARVTTPGAWRAHTALDPAGPLPFERGLLDAPAHRIDRFKPEMTAAFPSGWFASRNYVDGWSASHIDAAGELRSARIRVGLGGPCDNAEQVVIGSDPADLMDWLATRDDLDVGPPRAVNLGGQPGISVDVTPREGAQCPYSDDWSLFYLGEDIDWMRRGESLRIVAVDVADTTVAFLMYTPEGGLDRFADLAEPVLESLSFA